MRYDAVWLASQNQEAREQFLRSLTPDQAKILAYDWIGFWGRAAQVPPEGAWSTWVINAGRGFGKTRAGAEWVRDQVERHGKGRIALIAPTAADCRDVMVEGQSGLIAIAPPWNRPKYESSKRRVVWPNGAQAFMYSAEEPERLRGPQHDGGWLDELGAWRYPDATWNMYRFGLRLGRNPQTVVTSTPRPTPLMRRLLGRKIRGVVVTHGSTYDNRANLAPEFYDTVISEYEGTRLGLQELEARLLDDNPSALWKRDQIDATRVTEAPDLIRIVIAVDPSTSNNDESAETGIIVSGKSVDNHGYVLADLTLRGSAFERAEAIITAYHRHNADAVVVEVNNGGDWIPSLIQMMPGGENIHIVTVRATRGKFTRAEPVAAIYEQSRYHHVGVFPHLEDQLTEWMPGEKSPDRLDALVWGATELFDLRGVPMQGERDLVEAEVAPQTIIDALEKAQQDPFAYADSIYGSSW